VFKFKSLNFADVVYFDGAHGIHCWNTVNTDSFMV